MTILNSSSAHHLLSITRDRIFFYHHNSTEHSDVDIWRLKKNSKYFRIFLQLFFGNHRAGLSYEVDLIHSVFKSLDKNECPSKRELLEISICLLNAGNSFYFKKMKLHIKSFQSVLTPQCFDLFKKMHFNLPKNDELLFHTCNPDIYLWVPPKLKNPKKVIVIFPTKSNSLNMPRLLAHYILASLGISLVYIDYRSALEKDNLASYSKMESLVQLVRQTLHAHRYEEIFCLGVSQGGFLACQFGSLIGAKKILNFSGALPAENEFFSYKSIAPNFSHNNILSIASETDSTDKKIIEAYNKNGFMTPRIFLRSNSHGSFCSAFLEDKLGDCFSWLLKDA